MLPGQPQQRMVLEKPDQRLRRKIKDALHRGRPDRTRQWQNIVIAKPRPGAKIAQKFTHRQVGVLRCLFRAGVEVQNVAQHPQKARVGDATALGEQRIQTAQTVFQFATRNRRAKAHVAFNHRHGQFLKQRHKMRVIRLVIDDKPGIHRLIAAFASHFRTRVATKAIFRLKQHHRIFICQQMRRCHPRYAAPDHGNTPRGRASCFKWHLGDAPDLV